VSNNAFEFPHFTQPLHTHTSTYGYHGDINLQVLNLK